MAVASTVPKEIEDSINRHSEKRSEPYFDKRSIAELAQRGTFSRLLRLLKIGMPSNALLKMLVLTFFILGQTAIEGKDKCPHIKLLRILALRGSSCTLVFAGLLDYNFGNTGRMFGCLMRRDMPVRQCP